MFRIDSDGAIASPPTPAAVGTQGYFTEGNPGLGQEATVMSADWANAVQEELMTVIEEAGLTADKSDSTQLLPAIKKVIGSTDEAFAVAFLMNQIATPSNPASGKNKLYFKNDDKLYSLSNGGTESEIASFASDLQRARNHLLNSNFDIWQRGTSTTIANGATAYQADRWYGKNSLGTNGVLTFSRQAGTTDGSKYAAQLKITTAPTGSQANGCELYQTLTNFDSMKFYNKTASFSAKIKALGNVTTVGIQFMYKTSEGKVDTTIGSETDVTVNNSTFVTAQKLAQAMGSSMTTSGVVGIRIRIKGVSSGNTYDLNNGFMVEQAQMSLASVMSQSDYRPQYPSFAEELHACQRFYEKSYDYATALATATRTGASFFACGSAVAHQHQTINFKAAKRSNGYTVVVYDLAGASSKFTDFNGSDVQTDAQSAYAVESTGEQGFEFHINSGTGRAAAAIHWTADAEI